MTLWRNRDFAALFSAQLVSTLGATVTGTAMPLLVLTLTGSPADAGLVGAAGALPFLVAGLIAGPLVDRWNRRTILLAAEIVAGLALATVPIALWLDRAAVAHLAVVAFVQGLCAVFFGLAERAALPLVVPASRIAAAVARNEARSRGAALAGPPLGGLLFGLGRSIPFVADSLSYLLSALVLLFVRRDLRASVPPAAGPLRRSAAEGLRWVWRHPLVRAAILLLAVSNFVFQALVLVIVVLARDRGATPAAVGVMLGIYSAGGFLGALAATRLHRVFSSRTVIIGVTWVWAALLPFFAVATDVGRIGLLGAACAFAGPLFDVVLMAYAAVLVPNELMGRVMAAAMTVTWGVLPLASLAAGFLLTALGPVVSIGVLSAVMLAAALGGTLSPAVRRAPLLENA
ncbi:MFS transporter [Actinoplanes sp. CA-030573]|uniref:MFS transporter n=1 Tax=Actinoplanes sp. CA-030573 TaxID=3239898 RepID=UPI003D89C595